MTYKTITSSFGNNIKVYISGGSHEPYMSVDILGIPAGIPVSLEKLQGFMDRRAPGNSIFATPRKEPDVPEIQSGIETRLGKTMTNGHTIRALIRNTNTRSGDYKALSDVPRPGHADFTAYVKYGSSINMAGGGPFSARLTAPLCIAGGIAIQALETKGIHIGAHLKAVGGVLDTAFDSVNLSAEELHRAANSEFPVLDAKAGNEMKEQILSALKEQDSVGGIVEVAAIGLPAGLGGPMYEGLEGLLAPIFFGIPAVKGVEFGNGFECASLLGSQNNDPFIIKEDRVVTETNNHGGILGGITSGMPLICRLALKPTPSIGRQQKSVSLSEMKETTLSVVGRHDPCVAVRAVPVAEAALAVGLLDIMIKEFD